LRTADTALLIGTSRPPRGQQHFTEDMCSDVGIATGLQDGMSGVPTPATARHSSHLTNVRTVSGPTLLPIYLLVGLFPGVRAAGEVSNSPPYSTKLKKNWGYSYTPPICLHCADRNKLLVLWFFQGHPKERVFLLVTKTRKKKYGRDLVWPLCCGYYTRRE
jgi:hypothetical protein